MSGCSSDSVGVKGEMRSGENFVFWVALGLLVRSISVVRGRFGGSFSDDGVVLCLLVVLLVKVEAGLL